MAIAFGTAVHAQLGYRMGYAYGSPGTAMRSTIQGAHSLAVDGFYQFKGSGLSIGVELLVGTYGAQESDQYYAFDNGTEMLAPVNVSNNLSTVNAFARHEFLKEATITPFATAKLGMAHMGTRITIEDPRSFHTDECPLPLEDTRLSSDIGLFVGAGLGLRFDLGGMFKGLTKGNFFVDFSADYMWGSNLEYMSVNAPSGTFNSGENVEGVDFLFASGAQPEVIHEYHTGYLYRTAFEMTMFTLSFVQKF
jgi:hypothetical protein